MNTKRLRLEKEAQDHIDQVINESSSEASTDLINRLPSVCLAEIFMCLDIFDRLEVRKVCSNWKNTCDHQGWNDIKKFECKPSLGRTYNNRKMLQSDVSDVLSYCGRYLRQLKLSEFCDSSIMLLVHQTCINLTHLEIFFDCYHMLLDENHYAEAFISMIKLRSIKIQQNCVEGQPDLTFPTYVLNNLPEEINEIVVCIYDDKIYQLDFPLFLVDLEKFNELRRLDIKNYILTKDTMKEIAKKTTLVNLMLRSCIIENEDAELIFNPMNLESLEFSKGRVNKECITRTVNNCKVLKNLLVNLSSFDIKQITKLDKLKCLNLSHVDDLSITKIVSNLENLVELQLNCKNLSSDALQKISYLKELEWFITFIRN